MYQYCQGKIGILASALYPEFMSYYTYEKSLQRKKLVAIQKGGNGRVAVIDWLSLNKNVRIRIIEKYGDPKSTNLVLQFKQELKPDVKAWDFYTNYELPNGDKIPEETVSLYTNNVTILNTIMKISQEKTAYRLARNGDVRNILNTICSVVPLLPKEEWNNSLPQNLKRLKAKIKEFKSEGYECMIHGNFANSNSVKLNPEAQIWVLSRWANRVEVCTGYTQLLKEYNEKALANEWPQLVNDKSLRNYLNREDIKALWYGVRYGDSKGKDKVTYQHSTKLPSYRDSLWYSDGTKLNYFYQYCTKDGQVKIGTMKVYEVMDAYSEVLLGYDISDSEDFATQYRAYKMAIQFSGFRPYEIKFDNQGGHKKLETGEFFKGLARLSVKTKPYNGRSKTIENAFYRLQSQFMKKDWFFTGQNIQAKKQESKTNTEFQLANKANLPTRQEVMEVYKKRRDEWNNAPHPVSGKTRLETYLESTNPETDAVSLWMIVDMFWMTRENPVRLTNYGITIQEKKEKYTYMVYNEDGMPDIKFMAYNMNAQFVVKYDPEDMSMIMLYKKKGDDIVFVREAKIKTEIHRNAQEQEEWERSFIKEIDEMNNEIRMEIDEKISAITDTHNMSPEDYGMNTPGLLGLKKKQALKTKGNSKTKKVVNTEIAVVQKQESEIDWNNLETSDAEIEKEFWAKI